MPVTAAAMPGDVIAVLQFRSHSFSFDPRPRVEQLRRATTLGRHFRGAFDALRARDEAVVVQLDDFQSRRIVVAATSTQSSARTVST